jgi:Tol biopolymer transport system component
VDFEQGLNHCVRQIRTALGDDAEAPRFIETLPRRGYRFIYPVTAASVSYTLPSQAGAPLAGRHKTTLLIRLAAAVVIVGFLAYWFRPPLPAPRVSGFFQLTHDAVLKYMVGTDGARIYLGENVPGSGAQLAQVSVAGGDVVSLPTPSTNTDPITVSPDGSKVLATEKLGGVGDGPLWTLPTLGGSPRRLAGAAGHSGTWSPDGRRLVYRNGNELFLANANGTDPHKLASLPGPAYDLAWSPDAREIRFSLATSGARPVAIWQVSADGTKLHEFLPGWNPSAAKCCGRWTPDGNYFVFESNGQVWARRETGRLLHKVSHVPVQLTNGPLAYLGARPSKGGKRLFAVVGVPRGELNRYDRKARVFEPYLGGISAQDVAFSRDAKWVAYVSFPEGTLWRAGADGSEKIQLTFPPIYAMLPRWSPDNKEIVFSDVGGTRPSLANMSKPSRIYLVSAEGGKPRELGPNHSHSQVDPSWSPDGNSIRPGPDT